MRAAVLRLLTPDRLLSWPEPFRRRAEVQALTYAVLAEARALERLPPGQRESARGGYLWSLGLNVQRFARLDAVLTALAEAGIHAVVVKGGLLARTHYGDPGARPMSDLDLLCLPSDVDRAAAVLTGLGFVEHAHAPRRQGSGDLHDRQFVDGNVWIELHYRLWHELELPSDVAPVIQRAALVPFGDGRAWAPAAADHLYLVLIHAATHGFTGNALWMTDALLLADEDPAAWDGALELAQQSQALLPFAAAIDHLHLVFPDIRVPTPGAVAPLRRAVLRRLAPWLQRGEARLGRWGSRVARPLLLGGWRPFTRWALGKLRVVGER